MSLTPLRKSVQNAVQNAENTKHGKTHCVKKHIAKRFACRIRGIRVLFIVTGIVTGYYGQSSNVISFVSSYNCGIITDELTVVFILEDIREDILEGSANKPSFAPHRRPFGNALIGRVLGALFGAATGATASFGGCRQGASACPPNSCVAYRSHHALGIRAWLPAS
jgi:hypothetical protein